MLLSPDCSKPNAACSTAPGCTHMHVMHSASPSITAAVGAWRWTWLRRLPICMKRHASCTPTSSERQSGCGQMAARSEGDGCMRGQMGNRDQQQQCHRTGLPAQLCLQVRQCAAVRGLASCTDRPGSGASDGAHCPHRSGWQQAVCGWAMLRTLIQGARGAWSLGTDAACMCHACICTAVI